MKGASIVSTMTVCVVMSASLAQDTSLFPSPAPQHAFLKKFVGKWKSESEIRTGPNQPSQKYTGTMSFRMLGEFWVISDVAAEMPGGGRFSAVQTIGFNSKTGRYDGTWVDSVTDHMWTYHGTAEGETLTLEAEGPNFLSPGKTANFRDIYEFRSADEIAVFSKIQSDDGTWVTYVTGTMRRAEAGK
ncbi:MAG: DUF1579 domain-containing protein [Planctomycetaceae bacterium]|nr:DUF1579 domain-containing protein [Planctomycetaceae bacterium]